MTPFVTGQHTANHRPPTGLVRDDVFLDHDTGPNHIETPDRLAAIYAALDQSSLARHCVTLPLRSATEDELALIHTPAHIKAVAQTAGEPRMFLYSDTPTGPRSFEVARLAAGSALEAIDRVLEGDVANAFALVRPPGHHAEAAQAMGFCLFNNIALAARYATTRHGCARVLVVDFDVHHGNGTQHAFYDDASVLYFSTHQYPHYPGTGSLGEVGRGAGEGFTVNVPFGAGQDDETYLTVYRSLLAPIADEWRPDLVLVSAGFDAYLGDPLADMRITVDGFAALAGEIRAIADRHCGGRTVFLLEGGYHLDGLARGVLAVLDALAGPPPEPAPHDPDPASWFAPLCDVHGRYWQALG